MTLSFCRTTYSSTSHRNKGASQARLSGSGKAYVMELASVSDALQQNQYSSLFRDSVNHAHIHTAEEDPGESMSVNWERTTLYSCSKSCH